MSDPLIDNKTVVVPALEPPPAPVTTPAAPVPITSTKPDFTEVKEKFDKIDWVNLGFMTVGALALWYAIAYYRGKVKTEAEMRDAVNELKDKTLQIENKLSVIAEKYYNQRRSY